jgi:LysR family transcriptional regulator, regulator of abg operon
MKLNHVRDVLAIADQGSLRAAAQHLGMAQPALTRSIRELEHELNAALFERHARGMALTPAGQAFVARMRVVQAELERAQHEVSQISGEATGRVSIGLSIAANITLLPEILKPFKRQFPHVRLKVMEGVFPQLRKQLLDAELDFYVGPLIDQNLPRELVMEKLFDNQRAVLARKGHPLAEAKSLADLTGAHWIGTAIADRQEEELAPFFERLGYPAPIVEIESTSALSTILVAANTDLLVMLPRQYLGHPGASQLLNRINVKEKLEAPPMCMIRRSALPLTPAAEFLADLVRRAASHERKRLMAASG